MDLPSMRTRPDVLGAGGARIHVAASYRSFSRLQDLELEHFDTYDTMVRRISSTRKEKKKSLMVLCDQKKKKKKIWISPGEDRTPDLRIPQHNTAYKYDALTD